MTYDCDSTPSDLEGCDFEDHTDRRLITDISRVSGRLSSKNRERRRLQRLRRELVREHIQMKQDKRSWFRTWLSRLREL